MRSDKIFKIFEYCGNSSISRSVEGSVLRVNKAADKESVDSAEAGFKLQQVILRLQVYLWFLSSVVGISCII